jgi:hypothetical protein
MKFGLVHDKKYLLQYFGINENYSLGDKKVKLAIPETRQYYEGVPEHLKILVHKCKLNTEHYTEVLDMFNLLKGNCDSGKEYGPNFENRNPKTIGTVVFFNKWNTLASKQPISLVNFAKVLDTPRTLWLVLSKSATQRLFRN